MMYPRLVHNRKLFGIVAGLCVLLLIVASGGGLFHQTGFWMADWQHQAFRMLCHQDPARSFWINGKPMAVCTRCYGIYAGFSLLWLGLPMLSSGITFIKRHAGRLLVGAITVNIVDVVVNMLGFWQNTLASRTITGAVIGMTAVLYLADKFLTSTQKT